MDYYEFWEKVNAENEEFLWQREQQQKALIEMERLSREGKKCEIRLRKNFWIPGYFIRRMDDGHLAVILNPRELPEKGTKILRRRLKDAPYVYCLVQDKDFRLTEDA